MIKTNRVVVVEGKYDKSHLENIIDAIIITTDGFNIRNDIEKQALIKKLAADKGLLVLTDSDYAGMRIRRYVAEIAGSDNIINAYLPDIHGKEKRKQKPSSEGILGVEGISADLIEKAVSDALAVAGENGDLSCEQCDNPNILTKADLFEAGLIGTTSCTMRRHDLLKKLGLPTRLSTNQMLELLNSMFGKEKFTQAIKELE